MKKTLGYGFKMGRETIIEAVALYRHGGLLKSVREVKKEIKEAKAQGDISKTAKCKVFKVVVEIKE